MELGALLQQAVKLFVTANKNLWKSSRIWLQNGHKLSIPSDGYTIQSHLEWHEKAEGWEGLTPAFQGQGMRLANWEQQFCSGHKMWMRSTIKPSPVWTWHGGQHCNQVEEWCTGPVPGTTTTELGMIAGKSVHAVGFIGFKHSATTHYALPKKDLSLNF